ncbi:hypothetical protein FJW08_12390 [Mesorhizobium sp. B3-2-1]|uniref:hypothetical protein n=1 Tax=Mesorhizobium sp. B3-2-1 TaxID=2589891 RepID=UPI00112DAE8D|nr:hypothetical protein [Mesorhizobium sp. B3-2-1]TPI30914.1 hypothetical protein FJW08_12390 [Mesorhizobium sp. B3-2-1]
MVAPFSSLVGSMILSAIGILAYRWFGLIAVVIVGGIGFPALLALTFYWGDLKARKVFNPTDQDL